MAESGCLKDGHFHNLQVEKSFIHKKNFKSINTSGQNITKNDCGIIFINGSGSKPNASLAQAINVQLPAPETGLHYKFISNATFSDASSASFTISIGNNDNASFVGQINGSGVNHPTTGTQKIILKHDAITGAFIDLNCFVSGDTKIWHVSGSTNSASGVEYDP